MVEISTEEFVTLILRCYPLVTKKARSNTESCGTYLGSKEAFNWLVGMSIKHTKANISIPKLESEIKKQLDDKIK